MCAMNEGGGPIYQCLVSEERLDKVIAAIGTHSKKLTREQVLECIFEVGYGDAIDMSTANPFAVLTPLQHVAVAAALAVYAESGGKQVLTERYGGQG